LGDEEEGGGVAHKIGGWAVRVTFGAKDVREGFSPKQGGRGKVISGYLFARDSAWGGVRNRIPRRSAQSSRGQSLKGGEERSGKKEGRFRTVNPTKTCSKTQYIAYTAKALCESRADGRATADAGGKLRSGRVFGTVGGA